jgi:hypothetical protein
MNINKNLFLAFVVFSGSLVISCSPRDRYDSQLQQELSSGIRYDSLFMGLYFGMLEKDFYVHCWNLNKKGLVRQGESNSTVKYEMKEELNFPCQMDFYPRFNQGKICEMPVRFQYKGWAPWNKKLSSEKLQEEIVDWYEQVYGKGFIRVRHPEFGLAYVKLDGNRRITVFREDNMHVWAIFTDMLIKSDWSGLKQDTIR